MSELEQKLSRGDLYRLLDFIEFCRCADNQDKVVPALAQLDDIIPFQAGIVGLLKVSGSSLKQTVRTFSLGHSPEFLDNYSRQAFAQYDPLVARGLSESDPFSWEEAISSHTRPVNAVQVKKLLELSADYGLKRGLAYASRPMPRSNEVSYICLETGREPFSSAHSEALRFALPHLHELLRRVCQKAHEEIAPVLSVRELEVLQWLKEGKTAWEVGAILSISERTVKFHITNCYTKLNVTNRSQAIARAMCLNLI
ncbi:helix-turn-helix transcriptional regulator [Sulfurirhabdus autotrophica]|uniref:LuxR family transcriptional regulator n=1 Tax=Sulfurirhabdus autotrophica TaxID=1706046 RepID=A0A4R3Y2M6_9PROT|nr:LuxR family transcriptional regulator [Sulfurirhabdus autotrophica]TCV85827.1 LuxR family transcriptional regulator [Sulfurirhabdus autotrophica]